MTHTLDIPAQIAAMRELRERIADYGARCDAKDLTAVIASLELLREVGEVLAPFAEKVSARMLNSYRGGDYLVAMSVMPLGDFRRAAEMRRRLEGVR
jgi:hypothetical protein